MKKILVVDDEPSIREMIEFSLSRADFQVVHAGDAHEALSRIVDERPDLILLDWMMPEVSGIELARRLKKDEIAREIPVIMLTARSEENDKIRGLEVGADDYVTKPFSPRELIARIEAVLRRSAPEQKEEKMQAGALTLDAGSHRIFIDNRQVEVGPTEFRLLHFFMLHPDRVYNRSQLLDHVWGQNVYIDERTVDVHIRRLRKALSISACDKMVQTVRGAGYRFSAQV